MKESYREGVANHPDPESCEGGRKAALEALTGAQVGRVIELRNLAVEGADAVRRAEGNTAGDDSARPLPALAEAQSSFGEPESKSQGMSGNRVPSGRARTGRPRCRPWR